MARKKKEQYLVVQNGQKKIIIPMSDIIDIKSDPRIVIQGLPANLQPYVILFTSGQPWIAPLDDETIEKFRKFKGVV